jgi:heavy metal translocating P-type ATPase
VGEPKPGFRRISATKIEAIRRGDSAETTAPNLEDGLSQSSRVVLSVSGMTCVGCETKLQKSLATIKAIQNLRTSLVLCRAEFDLDLRYESVESVTRKMVRMTGFKIEEINQEGSEIEVCPLDVQQFLKQENPTGVNAVKAVDKSTVRISYDPRLVGARDIVERSLGAPLKLAPLKSDPGLAAGDKHVRHVGLMTLLSTLLTIPVLVLALAPLHERPVIYGSVSLALATLVQFIVAGPFYPMALKSLIFSRMIEMDLLIVISTSAAYIFSVVSFGYTVYGDPLATGEFFETSTLLVTLIMVGRFVSALARQKAVESVSVRSLQTSIAVIVNEQDSSQKEIDARLLQYGDLFRVAPESRVPTDGTVVFGTSEIDESMITGEPLPVEKVAGSVVIAGSINGSGVLTIRLSRLPESNTISTIARMVDEAKLSKPRIQDVADKVASYFVPVAIALAIITFVVWIPIGTKVRGYSSSRAMIEALTYGITIIIVSCPCAVGLAVPMVVMISGGVAAKHGCIFKTATTIEVAQKTSHVVFDKTGTLTQGKLKVASVKYLDDDVNNPRTVAATIASLLSEVRHPVAVAIKIHLYAQATRATTCFDATAHIGKGVEGTINGQTIKAGNSRWLGLSNHTDVRNFLSQGFTTFCVTIDDHFVAIYGLQDTVRPDAARTVSELQRRGIAVSIVSGDDEEPTVTLARQLNITTYRARCTPADKQSFMKDLDSNGKITTIFCGDGTNDAVALAQATIGVHMNEGTDVAQSAADVVLVRSSLKDMITLIDLSKAAMRRIAFNFAWSFVYNTVAILFASGALVNVRIPPAYAGFGELVSVLPVIAIAVQLRWAKFSSSSLSDV